LGKTRRREGRGGGPPVSAFEAVPGVPPISVLRLLGSERERGLAPLGPPADRGAHSHDFLALASPEVLGPHTPGAFLSWRSHPLLFPFARGTREPGVQRLRVPPGERGRWSERFGALDAELRLRRDGYREAALSHLTLLLVELSRLATDVVEDLRVRDEPLLAGVFGFIDERYREPISLRDVARAVGLTPGHLTTVVGRKTGRTVLEWIAERRMAEARRLLVETDLTVGEVGRRVGYADERYFARMFRRGHGATPLGWRRSGRP